MSSSNPASDRRFELIERIGAGAYGEVFLAQMKSSDSGFHRRVALKLLHRGRSDEDTKKRIRDEARILGHIQHRNVVTAFDMVRYEERWGVVMDYVPGCDLSELIQAHRNANSHTPLSAALSIGSEVAHALHAAWNAEDGDGGKLCVVHRDIKPSNVRLTPDGDVKVLDFGIATAQMAHREARTGSGLLGTLEYMAPERLNGGDGTPASDVYALSVLTLELLLNRPLGQSPASAEAHDTWLSAQITALREQLSSNLATSSLLVPLIRRGLNFNVDARPDANELADHLDYLARSAPGEGLRAFAGDFVPQVASLLGQAREPAEGVINAATGAWTGRHPIRNTPLPPALRSLTPPPTPTRLTVTPSGPPAAAVVQNPSRGPWIASGIVLAALLLAGVFWVSRPPAAPILEVQPRAVNETMVVAEPSAAPEEEPPETPEEELVEKVPSPPPSQPAQPRSIQPAPVQAAAVVPRVAAVPRVDALPEPVISPPKAPSPIGDVAIAELIAARAAPSPEPAAPVVEPLPTVKGTFVGNANGRPLTIRLRASEPGVIDGRVELVLGPSIRSFVIRGAVQANGAINFSDSSGLAFRGTLDGTRLTGTYQMKSSGKWQPFTSSRK